MAKYLVQASYLGEGVKGLLKEGGSGRLASVEKAVGGLGGKVESFYYALGEIDAFVIIDVPNMITAVAISLAVNASGLVKATITPLLSVEEIDESSKKTVGYRPPGA